MQTLKQKAKQFNIKSEVYFLSSKDLYFLIQPKQYVYVRFNSKRDFRDVYVKLISRWNEIAVLIVNTFQYSDFQFVVYIKSEFTAAISSNKDQIRILLPNRHYNRSGGQFKNRILHAIRSSPE